MDRGSKQVTEERTAWVKRNLHTHNIVEADDAVKEMLWWIKKHRLIKPSKDSITQFKPYRIIYDDELPS